MMVFITQTLSQYFKLPFCKSHFSAIAMNSICNYLLPEERRIYNTYIKIKLNKSTIEAPYTHGCYMHLHVHSTLSPTLIPNDLHFHPKSSNVLNSGFLLLCQLGNVTDSQESHARGSHLHQVGTKNLPCLVEKL